MTDYNALKVPDLKAMLGQRKLLQTGNKQALITRLQEDDEKAMLESKTAAKTDAKEDEITYSDDEATTSKAAVEKPAPTAVESKSEEPAKSEETVAPAEEAENSADVAGAEEDAEAAGQEEPEPEPETAEPTAPAPSFTMGLASTAVEDEAKKRAERAKRFGIEEDEAAKQRAERAKRFGLDQTELATSLDSALPERPLKRGRGRGADGDGNRPGKRQSLDRRGRRGGRGPKHGGDGGNNNNKSNRDRGGDTLSAAERAKAEQRAARFATS
ncbi:hypothetical protein E4U21_002630 [Claviceps maximensis]|nr:hypothetical protein E4U21_002630 [Claviceps maximensis]